MKCKIATFLTSYQNGLFLQDGRKTTNSNNIEFNVFSSFPISHLMREKQPRYETCCISNYFAIDFRTECKIVTFFIEIKIVSLHYSSHHKLTSS